MASRRFPRLEGEQAAPESQPAPAQESGEPGVAAPARSLEREGEPSLHEHPVLATHVCRACHFENRGELPRCLNCGSPLGGPDQRAFDQEIRAQRDARRRAPEPGHKGESHPSGAPPPAQSTAPTEGPLPAQERDAPGFGAVLSAGFLAASIFALVSMPVRFIFSHLYGGSFSWRGCGELALVMVTATIVFGVYGRQLRKL